MFIFVIVRLALRLVFFFILAGVIDMIEKADQKGSKYNRHFFQETKISFRPLSLPQVKKQHFVLSLKKEGKSKFVKIYMEKDTKR